MFCPVIVREKSGAQLLARESLHFDFLALGHADNLLDQRLHPGKVLVPSIASFLLYNGYSLNDTSAQFAA